MKVHRFYIKDISSALKVGDTYNLIDDRVIYQCIKVLRLEKYEYISLFDDKIEYLTEIKSLNNNKRQLSIEVSVIKVDKEESRDEYMSLKSNINKNYRQVNLYMSAIKKSNFELILEKSVELGIDNVIPIISERSERSNVLAVTSPNFTERAELIIIEATEQCGRRKLMNYTSPLSLSLTPGYARATPGKPTFLPSPLTPLQDLERGTTQNSNSVNIFAHIGAVKGVYQTLKEIKEKQKGLPLEINLFVGPEGGWTEREVNQMLDYGFFPVSLGQYVLRAETAAIVMAAAALSLEHL